MSRQTEVCHRHFLCTLYHLPPIYYFIFLPPTHLSFCFRGCSLLKAVSPEFKQLFSSPSPVTFAALEKFLFSPDIILK